MQEEIWSCRHSIFERLFASEAAGNYKLALISNLDSDGDKILSLIEEILDKGLPSRPK